ncbi:hypothetical protein ABC970_22310 [Bacillus licheniformis]|nr:MULTISPECIES: hypothetical protein [Bacillus]ASK26247.1 hypothetical protein BSSX_p0056 [Bacillus subtilis]MBW7636286.1 hypothetical protein [Bacillus licheniformis]MCA1184613.1 hypothetical protein [Bacillus licheniformis]MCQ5304554.1 hypothetical protein [Bacillus licheniformis]MDM5287416.1 hypothetical protein [Bacillus licheniformis]
MRKNNKEKTITYRDSDPGVREALINAQMQSDDPYEQFKWLKENRELTNQQSVIGMVDLVQMNFNVHQGEKVVLSDGEIDCLMRGLGDALRHMQKDLPEGVYRYIKINIEDALEHAIKQQKKRI